jgi:hypothetical protein
MVAAAGMLATMALLPGVASAWITWSGMDPIIDLGDRGTMSIFVEWPTEMTCDVGSTIDIKVALPKDVKGKVVAESNGSFPCADGSTVKINTVTEVVSRGEDDKAKITARAKDATAKFPLNLVVTVNGDKTRIEGEGNNNRVSGSVDLD